MGVSIFWAGVGGDDELEPAHEANSTAASTCFTGWPWYFRRCRPSGSRSRGALAPPGLDRPAVDRGARLLRQDPHAHDQLAEPGIGGLALGPAVVDLLQDHGGLPQPERVVEDEVGGG